MSATPEQIADVMSGENSLRQSEAAIDELLTVFLAKAEPVTRKLADEVYERFLYSVQDYLRDNAAWNLSVEIDRCRRVEAENRTLSETVRAQAERVRVLEGALEAIKSDAAHVIDFYNRNGPTWTGKDGHEYDDMSSVLGRAETVIQQIDAALKGSP